MAKYNYTILDIDPVGLKQVSKEDLEVVNTFEINSKFTPFDNSIEVHVYSLEDTLLYSDYNYTNQSYLQNSEVSANRGASEITVDPVADLYQIGYPFGGVKVVYNFLDNLYSDSKAGAEFFIEEISKDRKEIRLLTNQITEDDIEKHSDEILEKLTSNSYYDEFYLNFKNNDLLIGLNLKTQEYRDYTSVVVKLYEPLPEQYKVKSILTIVEKVTESRGFEVQAEVIPDEEKPKILKGPNFSVEVENTPSNTTEYLNYSDLFGYDTSNNYRELNALFNEKSINISIDYSDYFEYIHFSSANERLRNFKYKLDLINDYQDKIDSYGTGTNTHSIEYYQDQINTILKNFDHYDRHLYFESGSTSWPKTNSTKPYVNATGALTGSWYNAELVSTENYDQTNYNQLLNSVPEYLREDSRNAPYATFIHMVGQHFDNLWVYSKAVTDKYDNDNRLNKGISRDLVQDALKNFGVNLYNSNKSVSDLFRTFTGQFYQSGSESINVFVTSSNIPTSEDAYTNEVYKRLYHNLPLLLKAKGTERGLRALVSSFGIPTDNYITGSIDTHTGLSARIFGGSRTQERYTGPGLSTTSSLDKVRLDDTGSIVEGSTLSKDVSIIRRDDKYIIDSHPINIGYSPTDELEKKLDTILSSSFNIDDYIGDPRLAYSSSYEPLIQSASVYINQVMTDGSHNLQDYTRILKFYDNVIFKMVKDFLPARSSVSSGIIVRPHALERNKIKQVLPSATQNLITSSIEIGSYSGSDGGTYEGSIEKTTAYTDTYMTSGGLAYKNEHEKEQAKYNGELSGSQITISKTELDPFNPFKYAFSNSIKYKLKFEVFEEEPTPAPTPAPTPSPTPSPTPAPTAGPTPAPTPAPTAGPTPAPTPSCTLYSLSYTSGQGSATFSWTDCETGQSRSETLVEGGALEVCSRTYPVITNDPNNNGDIETLGSCTASPTPTPPPTTTTYYIFNACDGGETVAAAITTPLDDNLRYVDFSVSPARYFTYTSQSTTDPTGFTINNNLQSASFGSFLYGCP